MEIDFTTKGELITIPYIKNGKLIKLIGKNGVGKSMAAIFLELSCGNHHFKNEEQYKEIKTRLKECNINLNSNTDKIEVTITPGTWIYNKDEFKLEENSIGFFKLNNKRIDINQLRDLLSIKVIRGNENLETQIELITDIFMEIIDKYLIKNADYIEKLKVYQKAFSKSVNLNLIYKYREKQEGFAELAKIKIENQTKYDEVLEKLEIAKKKIELSEKIIMWNENDPITIKKEIEGVEFDIQNYETKYDENVAELQKTEEKLKDIEKTKKKQIQEYIEKKNKLVKSKNSLIKRIRQNFSEEAKEIMNAKSLNLIEEIENKKKEHLEIIQKYYDEEFGSKAKFIITLIDKIKIIQGILDECIADGLEDQIIIDDFYNDVLLKVSVKQLKILIDNTILSLESKPEHISLKEKLEELNKDVKRKSTLLNFMSDWKKIIKKDIDLNKAKTNITDNTLDQFIEPEKIKQYFDEQDSLINDNSQIKMKLNDFILRLEKLNERYHLTENLKPKEEIFNSLNKYYKTLPVNFEEERDKLLGIKTKLEKSRDGIEYNLGNLKSRIKMLEGEITDIKSEIIKIAKKFDYSKLNNWENFVLNHSKKVQILINNLLIPFSDYIFIAKNAFYDIKERKSIRKNKYIELISEIYNQFFLDTYNKPSFFNYVFKDYESIKDFDIINNKINFIKKDKTIDSRSLSDFSSGEKAYAFIRAMISLINKNAKYKILFIDEANALLDYIRAGDLENLQLEMIKNGELDKIINIFPIHETPDQLSEEFRIEFNKYGYYQEIVKV